ncbi:hypothetical protein BYT27DRAFT_7131823 [Phlegmacium glaucopus]|nr:hypothetical protein BYT27DRAFT_7131823 [Phlegmacium glaucopus]
MIQPIDALPSTVQDIVADCPQFRILVMGKTGCGKSSLINEVFGINDAQVSHEGPGKADINRGFYYEDNTRFILHDSQGFEPGEDANFNLVKNFIEERSKMPPKDRLHAIWICTTTPVAGDRVVETGVEKIVKMDCGHVPIIVVFTKYDVLVNSAILDAMDDLDLDDDEMLSSGEKKAEENFKALCANALQKTFGKVPALRVSIQDKYKHTIAELIEVTDNEVQRSLRDDSHTKPASLAWAIAQRGSSDTSIKASIDVGRKRYWAGLLAGVDFTGQRLKQCLDVIHVDIVSIWNIHDPKNYLASEDFKAKISAIVDDLVTNPATISGGTPSLQTVAMLATAASSPVGLVIASIGSTVIFAKWLFDVYQNTPRNIACIMGYVVDLTIIMHRLFKAGPCPSHEPVISALSDFAKSGELGQVHNDIRKFTNSKSLLRLVSVHGRQLV